MHPRDFLWQVQGNVLLPYANASCGRFLFYHFDRERLPETRAWVKAISERITYHTAPPDDGGVCAGRRLQAPVRRCDRDADGRPVGDATAPCTNVGFTFEGLRALGFDPFTLQYLPEEFRQGMRARAERLGDAVDTNPARLPVHAVVIVQVFDANVQKLAREVGSDVHAWKPLDTHRIQALETAVVRALKEPVAALPVSGAVTHLRELDQDTYTLGYGDGAGARDGLEYFGFRDGISQPRLAQVPDPDAGSSAPDADPGLVLLGWSPDGAPPRTRSELALEHVRDGSFLVLRKLAQDVDGFRARLESDAASIPGTSAARLAELMMGRQRDGAPLVPAGCGGENDFDYSGDPDGRACPFQSHVRRANPRDRESTFHRIMRRGVPYSRHLDQHASQPAEQGLLFQAYNADLGAQFELVQSAWLNAGAESRGLSRDRDPIAGCPAPADEPGAGEGRFAFTSASDGSAQAIRGLASYVRFVSGDYFLVPARHTLEELSQDGRSPLAEYARRVEGCSRASARDVLGRWLDDDACGRRIWQEVRERGGCVRLDGCGEAAVLVGTAELLETVLRDDGRRYSVREQGLRMQQTTGLFYLGMDACDTRYQRESQASFRLIPGWKSDPHAGGPRGSGDPAEETARAYAAGGDAANRAELDALRGATQGLCFAALAASVTAAIARNRKPGLPRRAVLDVSRFAAFVLSGLCPRLFGVPLPSASGTFLLNVPVSGYVFFPFPEESFLEYARDASHGISTYLASLFDERARRKAGTLHPPHPDWIDGRSAAPVPIPAWEDRLDETLSALESIYAGGPEPWSRDDSVRTLAGIVSGMLIASFKLFTEGIARLALRFEIGHPIEVEKGMPLGHVPYQMLAARGLSMPNVLYRTSVGDHELGGVPVKANDFVLACQGSAMAQSGKSDWFYGDRTPGAGTQRLAPHFCPGSRAADVVLGTMSTFLLAPGLSGLRGLSRKDATGLVLEYDLASADEALRIARDAARPGGSPIRPV